MHFYCLSFDLSNNLLANENLFDVFVKIHYGCIILSFFLP